MSYKNINGSKKKYYHWGKLTGMKILLVSPHPTQKRSYLNKYQYPSLTLQQIAGITPREHDVEIVDERYEDVNFDNHYDLVGISCLTYNSLRGYEISEVFRKKGVPVVFGGYHASLMPDEAKQHADSVVIGEAEYNWPKVLQDVQKGKLKPLYTPEKLVEPEDIVPARHDIGVYTSMEAIQASRGCPTGCEFCAMQKIEGPRFRGRIVDQIIEEMKIIKSRIIFFADASLTVSPPYSRKLFKEMTQLNKKFHCFGNINVLSRDDELLKLSSDAGVDKWYVGIESISQENINQAGKSTNKVENYGTAIKKIRDHGMNVTGFFIFGLDHDTPETFQKTLDAIYEWELDSASFSIVTPYPGTRLFERFEKEGRITNYDWSRYEEGKVNYKPVKLTEQELLDGIRYVARDFFSVKQAFKRSFNRRHLNPIDATITFVANLSLRYFYMYEKLDI
jgi:radical SAM superfamily enzyme YgiQ (UPF0313 family)